MRFSVYLIAIGLIVSGCTHSSEPPPPSKQTEKESLPILSKVTEARTDLLYRYATKEGFSTASKVSEIPVESRGFVQVIDLALSPAQRRSTRYAQIFDLRTPDKNGLFPGQIIQRAQLEATLAKKAEKPPQAKVTMYSTSWCGVCKKASKFLTKNGIAFVEKDIEKDKDAGRELRAKAKAAGVTTNGVPVFDIGGKLIQGFDGNRILKATKGG